MAFVIRFLLLLLFTFSSVDVSPINKTDWVCSKNTSRQVRSTAEKELQSLIYTINHKLIPDIKTMYPHQTNAKKRSCPRVNKLINSISAEQDIVLAHKKFHKSLMEMSVFLDQLKRLSVDTHFVELRPVEKLRQEIYATTKLKLGLVICEFDDIITFDYNASVFDFNVATKRSSCIPKDADLSQIGALDMQFFTKLRRLFRAGKAILKKLKRKSHVSRKRTHLKNGNKKRAKLNMKKSPSQ